jgi:hypothetical protein
VTPAGRCMMGLSSTRREQTSKTNRLRISPWGHGDTKKVFPRFVLLCDGACPELRRWVSLW